MATVNRATVIGRLGRDVEVKTSQAGNPYCYFSLATDDYIGKGADGKAETETTWHDVKVFGKLASIAGEHGKKGGTVFVEGRMERKKGKDKDGKDTVYFNIIAAQLIMFDRQGGSSASSDSSSDSAAADRAAARAGAEPAASIEPNPAPSQEVAGTSSAAADDDLPF